MTKIMMSKDQILLEVNKKIKTLEYKDACKILQSILKHTPNDKFVKKKLYACLTIMIL